MRWHKWVIAALTVILVWLTVWPTALGGRTDFVRTTGVSMEPRIHEGDLVVTRRVATYRPGDVVAYNSDLLDITVLHRIVSVDNGEYTFQGDNNSFLDPDTPTVDNFIGKEVFLIPQGGVWLDKLTSLPVLMGVATFLIVLASIGAQEHTRRDRRRRRTWAKAPRVPTS